MSNDISEEDWQYAAEQAGKKPWEVHVEKRPDGSFAVTPVADLTKERNPLSVFGLRAAARFPGAAAGAVGGTALSTALAPEIETLAGATGPAAPLTSLVGHGLAFTAGAGLSEAGIDTMLDPAGRFIGSKQQQMRDRIEHPWATKLADIGATVGAFRLQPNYRELGSALHKAAHLRRLAQGDLGLTAAESAALKGAGSSAAMNVGIGTASRALHGEDTGLGDVAQDIGYGALFGGPRGPLEPLGKSLGGATRNIVGNFAAKFRKPTGLTPVEAVNTTINKPRLTPQEELAEQQALRESQPDEAPERVAVPDHPTPEPVTATAAAAEATTDPASTKKAVLVPNGSRFPDEVKGMPYVRTQQGWLFYDPRKITREQVLDATSGPQIDGEILGLSQHEKPADGNLAVVTDKGPAKGITTEVVTPEQVQAAEAAGKAAVPGATTRVLPVEQAVAERHEAEQFELPMPDEPLVIPRSDARKASIANEPPLPENLAGATPRYNYGNKSFKLDITSPIERAAYIVGGKFRSKQHDAYLEYLHTAGYSDADIATIGDRVRATIKASVAGQPGGTSKAPRDVRFQEGQAEPQPDLVLDPSAAQRRGLTVRQAGPTTTDTGAQAAGYYDPANPSVVNVTPHANPDTINHEAIHAEIRDMLTSPNERVRRFASDLVDTFGEEPLAEHGGRVPDQNRLIRLIRDNWAFVKHLTGFSTPESAARLVAERFAFHRPYEAADFERMRGPGAKRFAQEPGVSSNEPGEVSKGSAASGPRQNVLIPMSIYARLEGRIPGAGNTMANFGADRAYTEGVVNKYSDALSHMPHDVVTSAINKRIDAHANATTPQFTPEEAKANELVSRAMEETSDKSNERGFSIPKTPNYFPHMVSSAAVAEYRENPEAAFAKYFPAYDKFNQTYVPLHGGEYSPQKSRDAFLEYLKGTVGSDTAVGHFAALTRSAREYGLPAEMRDPDPQNALRRYGQRWANELARKRWIDDNPEMQKALGLGGQPLDPKHDYPEVIAARKDISGSLWQPSEWRKSGEVAQGLMQLGRASAMQTVTGIKNLVQSSPMHVLGLGHATDVGEVMLAHAKAAMDYDVQRAKAVAANATRAHNNELVYPEFSDFSTSFGQSMKRVANVLGQLTGARQLETLSRVRDFTVGERLAEVNLALPGDPAAEWFMRKHAAGVTPDMPHEEQVARIARNYMESIQGARNASDLPAAMLDGNTIARLTAMQRYGVGNFNRVMAYAVKPAMEGNWAPLLMYLGAGALTAGVVKKMTEALWGRPAMPTDEELRATGQDNLAQNTLNWMQLAEMGGMFGTAGNVSSAIANTVRGGSQPLVSDPGISYGVSLIKNLTLAIEAVHAGEQPGKVIQEAVQRSVLEQMQLGRLGREDAEDRRNKKVFEYLTGSREPNLMQVLDGLGLQTSVNGPKIRPSHEQVQQGDPAGFGPIMERAKASHSLAEINALDNYPGGFSTEKKEEPYRRFLLETKGQSGLDAYLKRRARFEAGVQQAGQLYQQGRQ